MTYPGKNRAAKIWAICLGILFLGVIAAWIWPTSQAEAKRVVTALYDNEIALGQAGRGQLSPNLSRSLRALSEKHGKVRKFIVGEGRFEPGGLWECDVRVLRYHWVNEVVTGNRNRAFCTLISPK